MLDNHMLDFQEEHNEVICDECLDTLNSRLAYHNNGDFYCTHHFGIVWSDKLNGYINEEHEETDPDVMVYEHVRIDKYGEIASVFKEVKK